MTKPPTFKHLISQLVNLFSMAAPSLHIKEARIKDTGEVISDELWAKGLNRIKLCSINARLHLIQFKVVYRLHYSKTKLNIIFFLLSPPLVINANQLIGIFFGPALSSQVSGLTFFICTVLFDNWFLTVSW